MKTRSKRFLNLATLCLALLGITLLMARPVKAEFVPTHQQSGESSRLMNDPGEDSSSEESTDSNRQSLNRESEQDDEAEAQDAGWQKGLEAGKNSSIWKPALEFDEVPQPDVEYSDYVLQQYKEGYMAGYAYGWGETHELGLAVLSVLQWVWGSIFGY
ncbi:TPA: hypothetical protein VO477_000604 [Streptococcus pyogenes]|nr:hypothetical protein [Streptococcus pyogenes]HER8839964.1 hypothetical protein [Streptococcus pyogenes]HES5080227.1 hypothetical protein [Streptococcus pyogenes]HES6641915.1 hypothetical protein [Streptococcus pyogenes]HES8372730.1 hypothetical protein [Streptococcus pyogenes]